MPTTEVNQGKFPHCFALALLLGAFLFGGCHFGKSVQLYYSKASENAPRLGWFAWPTVNSFMFCKQRVNDDAQTVGSPGPCWSQDAPDGDAKKMMSWLGMTGRDRVSPLAVPWEKCQLEMESAPQGAPPAPAKLWMLTPTGRVLLDEWPLEDCSGKASPTCTADALQIEATFSPEGKWLAIARLAIGIGDGERVIDPIAVKIVAVPACQ